MSEQKGKQITDIVGKIPYRLALAGGWIDQPFVSELNPSGIGSMVTVAIEPEFRFMDRCGICSSTRIIAMDIWDGVVPDRDPEELVRELYEAENQGCAEPSGSQDMIGLVYPGVNRLDYDFTVHGGYFPRHTESNSDADVAAWFGKVLHILPVAQRPDGYNPLGRKHLDPQWIARLGQSGPDCYQAIVDRDLKGLGASFNECMACWEAILPDTVEHPTLTVDIKGLLRFYQDRYIGAMYSGCGGGYLYVIADEPVPGALGVTVRVGSGGHAS